MLLSQNAADEQQISELKNIFYDRTKNSFRHPNKIVCFNANSSVKSTLSSNQLMVKYLTANNPESLAPNAKTQAGNMPAGNNNNQASNAPPGQAFANYCLTQREEKKTRSFCPSAFYKMKKTFNLKKKVDAGNFTARSACF